jgi:La domain
VEYYFSDENMATDKHLMALCGGSLNLPVSLGEILGWKRMRKFKPKSQVIASLKTSEFLEVLDGNKTIRRRVPFNGVVTIKLDDNSKVVTLNQQKQFHTGEDEVESPVQVHVPSGYISHNGIIKKMSDMTVCEYALLVAILLTIADQGLRN